MSGKQCATQGHQSRGRGMLPTVRLALLCRACEIPSEPKGPAMKLPIEIRFRNVECPSAIEDWIRDEVQRLERFYGGILGCHVMVELPHQHRQRGNPYHVRVELAVRGGKIVVKHQPSLYRSMRQTRRTTTAKQLEVEAPHKDLRLAISHTFRVIGRRLQDYVRRRRGQTKIHSQLPTGRVCRIFPDEGYGFLETVDGREIYFHRRSVLFDRFLRLQVGTVVTFAEEPGERGPQASTVRLIHRRRSEKPKKELLAHV